jgi:hypothetical protein
LVIVSLNGGLGNQLFQYALGRKLSIQNKETLLLDFSILKTDYLGRKLVLDNFRVKGKIIDSIWIRKIVTNNTRLNRIVKYFNLLTESTEQRFNFKPEILDKKSMINYFNGFWQSYKYFQDIRETLLKELVISTPQIADVEKKLNFNSSTVCIHVRRKDYLKDNRYGFVGEVYYYKAISLITAHVPNPHFIVFSDDIEWCKNNLNLKQRVTYLSGEFKLTDWEELIVMSKCHHHITANSTFSWWGAWLCNNAQQIVTRPSKPFKDSSLLYEYHYPDSWIAVIND